MELEEGGTIVVLTDGEASDSGLDQVIERAQQRSTEIYAVGLGSALGFADLTELGQHTGGGMIRADDAAGLESRFRGISDCVFVGRVTVSGAATFDALPPGTFVSGDGLAPDRIGSRDHRH